MVRKSKPTGPVAAAFIASGIGSFVLGLATTGSAASEGMRNALRWSAAVGPLSGKTGLAVLAWLAAWLVLGTLWRGKDVPVAVAFRWTVVLVAVGLLFTFPLFFELFE